MEKSLQEINKNNIDNQYEEIVKLNKLNGQDKIKDTIKERATVHAVDNEKFAKDTGDIVRENIKKEMKTEAAASEATKRAEEQKALRVESEAYYDNHRVVLKDVFRMEEPHSINLMKFYFYVGIAPHLFFKLITMVILTVLNLFKLISDAIASAIESLCKSSNKALKGIGSILGGVTVVLSALFGIIVIVVVLFVIINLIFNFAGLNFSEIIKGVINK